MSTYNRYMVDEAPGGELRRWGGVAPRRVVTSQNTMYYSSEVRREVVVQCDLLGAMEGGVTTYTINYVGRLARMGVCLCRGPGQRRRRVEKETVEVRTLLSRGVGS